LAGLFREAVAHPDKSSNWVSVLNWPAAILQPPKRSGKRHNLCAIIKNRISGFLGTVSSPADIQSRANHSHRSTLPSSTLLSHAVAAKLEDGNLRAAIRILTSEEAPEPPSSESVAKLQEKHPPASELDSSLPSTSQFPSLAVNEEEVRHAVLSFPGGSSGGPDGLRPQHLRDLVLCRENGGDFLSALTAFTNLVLAGQCPTEVARIFFGGRLLAFKKKTGGVRPIVVGFTLRRLSSKCANAFGVSRLVSYFSPKQLGVGLSGGCEAAVHSARRFLDAMPPNHVFVKLDFHNAFNSLHRSDMLRSVADRVPELYAYCSSAYGSSSLLFHGSYTLLSQEGPQQGDPLGPLLFCNTIHPLLLSLQADLNMGYLDDLSVGGPVDAIADDVVKISTAGQKLGLTLNAAKCELIAHPDLVVEDPLLRSFQRVTVPEASLLGAPLFEGPALDQAWLRCCGDLSRAVERLKLIGSQEALTLLRASFSAPRVMHLMRCSPSWEHPGLQIFDDQLRSAISHITNSDLSDIQWLQASLPVRDGGLGVRRVASLALPAFIASAASTLPLQANILSDCICSAVECRYLKDSLSVWSAIFGSPPELLPSKQSFWDQPVVASDRARVEASLDSQFRSASFLAATSRHSGDWLFALPIASCGLKLDDEAVRVAVGLRLGLEVCVPHPCRCGSLVDAYGLHSLVCKQAPGRSSRHHMLNDVVARSFTAAGIPVVKEPAGLFRRDGKRPDGLTLLPFEGGKPLTWDVTVVCSTAESYIDLAAQSPGAVAEMAAARKEEKYSDLLSHYLFQPIAVETLGAINDSACDFLNKLGRRISFCTGDDREVSYLFQRISVSVQRFNAVLLFDSFDLSALAD
jgi:hypothetical protein